MNGNEACEASILVPHLHHLILISFSKVNLQVSSPDPQYLITQHPVKFAIF